MAVLNAQYKHPASNYSQGLKTLIDTMLKVNPQERPDIHQVILSHTLTPLLLLTNASRSLTLRPAFCNLLDSQVTVWSTILFPFKGFCTLEYFRAIEYGPTCDTLFTIALTGNWSLAFLSPCRLFQGKFLCCRLRSDAREGPHDCSQDIFLIR